jgi:hypothetical protein
MEMAAALEYDSKRSLMWHPTARCTDAMQAVRRNNDDDEQIQRNEEQNTPATRIKE